MKEVLGTSICYSIQSIKTKEGSSFLSFRKVKPVGEDRKKGRRRHNLLTFLDYDNIKTDY